MKEQTSHCILLLSYDMKKVSRGLCLYRKINSKILWGKGFCKIKFVSFYYYSGHRMKYEITNKLKNDNLNYLILQILPFLFQLSGEVILQIASEPVLPFSALDIALKVQNSLRGKCSLNAYNFDEWKSFQILSTRTR